MSNPLENFTNQLIDQTFQKVIHIADDGFLVDGTGSYIDINSKKEFNGVPLNSTGSGFKALFDDGIYKIINMSSSGEFVLTQSFNNFTTSYYLDSASFNSQIYILSSSIYNINLNGFVTTQSFNNFTYSYYQDSNSFDNRLNNITQSVINTSSFVLTQSFNNYTQSINQFTSSYYLDSSSFNNNINQKLDTSSYNIDSASFDSKINQKLDTSSFNNFSQSINQFTQSYYQDSNSFDFRINQKLNNGSFNTFTSSYIIDSQSWNLIDSQKLDTSSYNLFTSSYIIDSASFDSRINFKLNIITFNLFTSSYQIDSQSWNLIDSQKLNTSSFNNFSSSYNIDSASFDSRIKIELSSASFNSFTASYYLDSASFLSLIDGKLDTSSYNIDSTSFDSRINLKLDISTFNLFTSSYSIDSQRWNLIINTLMTTQSFNNFTSSYYLDSASFLSLINGKLNTSSYLLDSQSWNLIDSQKLDTSSYIIDSASFDIRINSKLNTSSYNIDSSSFSSSIYNNSSSIYTISQSIDGRIVTITNTFVTTSSFNTFTQSYIVESSSFLSLINGKLNTASYNIDSSSFDIRINQKLDTSSFNSYTSSMWQVSGSNIYYSAGNVGIKTAAPTAYLHLAAGTAASNSAPLKLTSGILMTTPEIGAIEFNNDDIYAGITTTAMSGAISGTTIYTSVYPPAFSDTYVKATSANAASHPYNATNPTNSLIGSDVTSWWTPNGNSTNQRFHIDLGTGSIIQRIYYENYHFNGTLTDGGVKNFTFWGSNNSSSFAEVSYSIDTNWTQITGLSQTLFDQHVAANTPDPKYITITGNSSSYRYYAFKFADRWATEIWMALRRVELQSGFVSGSVTGSVVYLRKGIILNDGTNLIPNRIPYATTNGRLVDTSSLVYINGQLGINTATPNSVLNVVAKDAIADYHVRFNDASKVGGWSWYNGTGGAGAYIPYLYTQAVGTSDVASMTWNIISNTKAGAYSTGPDAAKFITYANDGASQDTNHPFSYGFYNATQAILQISKVGNLKLITGAIIYPATDSATAIKFNKADATTPILILDSTNKNVIINTSTNANSKFQVYQALTGSFPISEFSSSLGSTVIENDGTIVNIGNATTFNDLVLPFFVAKTGASNVPDWATVIGNLNSYSFKIDDYLTCTSEMLHSWKTGSNLEFHMHWATNGIEAVPKYVTWEMEYSFANHTTGQFSTSTIISGSGLIASGTADRTHIYTSIGTITTTSKDIGAILLIRIRRITAVTGSDPANNPFGLSLGIHYEQDTIGSRLLSSK